MLYITKQIKQDRGGFVYEEIYKSIIYFDLIKVGKNKYKTKSQEWLNADGSAYSGSLIITVKKKSISVKPSNSKMRKGFKGWFEKYKLVEHYYA